MAFLLLEGLDRTGKSTVAELYKKKGYEIVHMSAPDKKYFVKGYSGSSYLEEIVNLYTRYSGKNIVFDRTPLGELIWPEIFNRQSLLAPEDIEYLQQIEDNNDAVRVLMYDEDKEAHWQRCVTNNEPLSRLQFIKVGRKYDELSKEYRFEKKQLSDYIKIVKNPENTNKNQPNSVVSEVVDSKREPNDPTKIVGPTLVDKLKRANAIRDLLEQPLVKKKGEVFEQLDKEIKSFLEKELENVFTETKKDDFTNDEVKILKIYAQRIKDKMS